MTFFILQYQILSKFVEEFQIRNTRMDGHNLDIMNLLYTLCAMRV